MCAANTHKLLKTNSFLKLGRQSINWSRSITNAPIVVPVQHYWLKYSTRKTLFNNVYLNKTFYSTVTEEELVDSNTYERICEETLDSLAEYFEELIASEPELEKADITYGAGVLTLDLGTHGTYVINRQSPNRQIWLSSPASGPKRYDYSVKEDCWIYKHDGETLHSLLQSEISSILHKDIDISNCSHGR